MAVRKKSRTRKGQAAAEHGVSDLASLGGPFVEAVEATRMPMAVTDPRVADNPIIYANPAFLELSGYAREEVLGQGYFFLMGQLMQPEMAAQVAEAMAAHRKINVDVPLNTKDGRELWVTQLIDPIVQNGQVVQHFASFMDITVRVRREAALREVKETLDRRVATRTQRLQLAKERLEGKVERRRRTEAALRDALAQGQEDLRYRDFLVREVNHRTKNALQMAVTLLELQARQSDPGLRDGLRTAMGRLKRIGEVHALLTYEADKPDSIDVPPYLRRLCQDLSESLAPHQGQVQVAVDVEEGGAWGPDLVIPLGMIVGEALTKTFKYAFPDGRKGQVRVELHAAGEGLMTLRIWDDGVGLPKARRKGSLGLKLIDVFAQQIKGSAAVERRRDGEGTAVVVTFPVPGGSSA